MRRLYHERTDENENLPLSTYALDLGTVLLLEKCDRDMFYEEKRISR